VGRGRNAPNCICTQNQNRNIAAESDPDEPVSDMFVAGENAAAEAQEERPNMEGAEAPCSKHAAEYVKASNFTGQTYHAFGDQELSFLDVGNYKALGHKRVRIGRCVWVAMGA